MKSLTKSKKTHKENNYNPSHNNQRDVNTMVLVEKMKECRRDHNAETKREPNVPSELQSIGLLQSMRRMTDRVIIRSLREQQRN